MRCRRGSRRTRTPSTSTPRSSPGSTSCTVDRAALALQPEQLRLLERLHTDFVRAGAGLGEPDQQQLRALNERLSTLTSTFSTRLLAETRDLAVHVEDRAELDGLAEDAVAAAEQAARTRGPGRLPASPWCCRPPSPRWRR